MTKLEAKKLSLVSLKKQKRRTKSEARRLALSIGKGILIGIADCLQESCPHPFEEDGSLSDAGFEAAADIAHYLLFDIRWLADVCLADLRKDMVEVVKERNRGGLWSNF